jgi:hypothetical protein
MKSHWQWWNFERSKTYICVTYLLKYDWGAGRRRRWAWLRTTDLWILIWGRCASACILHFELTERAIKEEYKKATEIYDFRCQNDGASFLCSSYYWHWALLTTCPWHIDTQATWHKQVCQMILGTMYQDWNIHIHIINGHKTCRPKRRKISKLAINIPIFSIPRCQSIYPWIIDVYKSEMASAVMPDSSRDIVPRRENIHQIQQNIPNDHKTNEMATNYTKVSLIY